MYHIRAVLFFGLAACGGAGSGADAGTGAAQIGTGTTAFEALAEGAELAVIAGPQGGHHLIVHARMQGLLPGDPTTPGELGNPITEFAAYLDGRRVDAEFPPFRLGYEPGDEGWLALVSGRLLVLDEAEVEAVIGEPLRIELSIEDVRGVTAVDSIEVLAVAGTDETGLDAGLIE